MVSVFGRRLSMMKKSDNGAIKEEDSKVAPTPTAVPASAAGGGILSGFRETVSCAFFSASFCANAVCL
jgi:hypothetical protein